MKTDVLTVADAERATADLIGNARGEIYSMSFSNRHLAKACGDMLVALDIMTGCADTGGTICKTEKNAAVDALKAARQQIMKSNNDYLDSDNQPKCENAVVMIESAIERIREI